MPFFVVFIFCPLLPTWQVQTLLQGVHIREDSDNLPISVKRQTTAFPPNFVHSLDSTHMMLTAVEMDKVGVPFAAVHDSYWVHAGNVDVMNDELRQVRWFSLSFLLRGCASVCFGLNLRCLGLQTRRLNLSSDLFPYRWISQVALRMEIIHRRRHVLPSSPIPPVPYLFFAQNCFAVLCGPILWAYFGGSA